MKVIQGESKNIYRLLRIARDKKVKDIAEELLVTPAYINAIENGERTPSIRLIKDYAKVLDVEEDIILHFEANENKKFEQILLLLLKKICEDDGCED